MSALFVGTPRKMSVCRIVLSLAIVLLAAHQMYHLGVYGLEHLRRQPPECPNVQLPTECELIGGGQFVPTNRTISEILRGLAETVSQLANRTATNGCRR